MKFVQLLANPQNVHVVKTGQGESLFIAKNKLTTSAAVEKNGSIVIVVIEHHSIIIVVSVELQTRGEYVPA